jgi:predicted MFS family arabinose efflux permease
MVARVAIDLDSVAPVEGVAGSSMERPSAVPPSASGRVRQPVVRLFLSVFLSLYGDWLTTVALVVLLFRATGNAAGPAGYLLARVAPRVIGPWIGGSLADRLSPRRVIVVASCMQGVLTASLVLSDRTQTIWAIYAAVAVAQFLGSVARPSQGAWLPRLVPDAWLPRANAIWGLFFETSIFVAPAIGALLLSRTGADLLFMIDACTFLIAALLAATLPLGERIQPPPVAEGSPLGRASTWSMAARDAVIRLVAAANFAMGLTITIAQAFLVLAAHERLGNDDAVGLLYVTVGLGGTAGGLLALRWTPPRQRMLLALFVAITVDLIALAGFGAVAALAPGLILLAFSTLASATLDVWGITEIQRRSPAGYGGRFNAIPWASQYAGMLVGALWALGTTVLFHWDVSLEIACLGSALLVGAVGLTGGHEEGANGAETEKP